MKILRVSIAFILTVALVVALACSPQKLAHQADNGAKACADARRVFQVLISGGAISQDKGQKILDRLDEGERDFGILAGALRSGNTSDALSTMSTLIDVTNALIEQDAQLIKDPAQRTIVLTFLAAADLALHIIADNLAKTADEHTLIVRMMSAWAPQQTQAAAEKVKRFARTPRLRCRDAKSGRFQKMEVCQARPDTTVVERAK